MPEDQLSAVQRDVARVEAYLQGPDIGDAFQLRQCLQRLGGGGAVAGLNALRNAVIARAAPLLGRASAELQAWSNAALAEAVRATPRARHLMPGRC